MPNAECLDSVLSCSDFDGVVPGKSPKSLGFAFVDLSWGNSNFFRFVSTESFFSGGVTFFNFTIFNGVSSIGIGSLSGIFDAVCFERARASEATSPNRR